MNPYFEQRILGAGPIELVRFIYQRAISCVREAREHLEARRISARSASITRAYMALSELMGTLELEVAPELAGRLQDLYLYMQQRLLDANAQQADRPLAEVLSLLTTLSEAWNQVPDEPDRSEPGKSQCPWRNGDGAGQARIAVSA